MFDVALSVDVDNGGSYEIFSNIFFSKINRCVCVCSTLQRC